MNRWNVLAWLFILCGIGAWLTGWASALMGSVFWVPTGVWFSDALAAGIFGVFFLIQSKHKRKR